MPTSGDADEHTASSRGHSSTLRFIRNRLRLENNTFFPTFPGLEPVGGDAWLSRTQVFVSFVPVSQHQKLPDSGTDGGRGRGGAPGRLDGGGICSLPPSSRCPLSPTPPAHLPFFLPPQAKLQLSDFSLLGSFQLDVLTSLAFSQCVCASAGVCFWCVCV